MVSWRYPETTKRVCVAFVCRQGQTLPQALPEHLAPSLPTLW